MRIQYRYVSLSKNKALNQVLTKRKIKYAEEEKQYTDKLSYYFLSFFIYEDEEDFLEIRSELEKFQLKPQVGTEFSKKDYEEANWYHLHGGGSGYPQPWEYKEASYDLSQACPTCSIGKIQNRPFRLSSEPKAKTLDFIGLTGVYDQIFVRQSVKDIFEKEGVTGITFSRPVLHKTGLPLKTVYQLEISTVLPSGLLVENINQEICKYPKEKGMAGFLKAIKSRFVDGPYCGQMIHNYPMRGTMNFKSNIFEKQPDFVRTHEWFGSGGQTGQPILISRKTRNIIEKYKLKGAYLKPVTLIE